MIHPITLGRGLYLLMGMALLLSPGVLLAQGTEFENRPVSEVRLEGVREADRQLFLNQINIKAGDPYAETVVAQDIENLTRLNRFGRIRHDVSPQADGTVVVIYRFEVLDLLSDVQVVGNKKKSDKELLDATLLRAGDPRDPFLINQARERILDIYKQAGYFLADVSADEKTLEETGILILRVREGPRVRVRELRFEGNAAFPSELLASKLGTKSYQFIFSKGVLSDDQMVQDEDRLRRFYEDRGYLDVRVGHTVLLTDDQNHAAVKFIIDEGRPYTVREIKFSGATVYTEVELRQAMTLKVGDVYSPGKLKRAFNLRAGDYVTDTALADLYGKLGRIETIVRVDRVFHETDATVDLIVTITESQAYTVGAVHIRGNTQTQDKVFRRHIRGIEPGRRYDSTGIEETERRIRSTGLVDTRQPDSVKTTFLGDLEEQTRDALIEVKEGQTGSFTFGAAVSSDSGVFGAVDLTQRNFDITDVPESWGEFFTGRAFKGAGQYFSVSLQPGNEFQRYQVTFREPYLFDSDFYLSSNAFFFTRLREKWDEEQIGGSLGLGKRFGDVWSAEVRGRGVIYNISDIEEEAPVDVYAVEGRSTITAAALLLTRSDVDDRFFPTRGTRWTGGLERVGLVGDYDFTKLSSEFDLFLTVDEDFFGRKTVLSFSNELGFIPDAGTSSLETSNGRDVEISDVPLFERFYAGGHSSFRGFDFRGVGPRGIQFNNGKLGDDPVGGRFMFLLGSEYNFPIYENFLRGVFFVDTGTVQNEVGFEDYRVSIGGGVRLALPFFGQAPFAFDLAYPLVKEDTDETRLFSFDVSLPF